MNSSHSLSPARRFRPLARLLLLSCLSCLSWTILGCDDAKKSDIADLSHLPAQLDGKATVRGRVLFAGTPPVMKTIENQPCHDGAGPMQEESVVVDAGGLKNVFVYVKNGPATNGSLKPAALLDQVNCRYVPHVLAVQVGQPVRIRSSDPTLHNVHYTPSKNRSDNLSMTRAGEESTVTFAHDEFIRVRCDVHPWMNAWVGVFSTPLHAVTGDAGAFELTNVPAGTYTLAAWHEVYGEQTQSITVGPDGATGDVTFTFAAK
jgi:plastocyanin